MSICIFSCTQTQYADLILSRLGKGYLHAQGIYKDWFQKGRVESSADWIQPQAQELVKKIIEITDFRLPEISQEKQEGELVKFLLKFSDGLESESVIIPMKFGVTLCISSQVGCRMGCTFCQTGKMGLLRNLSAQEIVSQVFFARHTYGKFIRNIVFMGMGEPMDNFDEVKSAIAVLSCSSGLQIAPSRITISTSGVISGIYRMIDEIDPAINLAVSVNAPNNDIRRKIMPVNQKWNMDQLKIAMADYCANPRRAILAEYVLLEGINDSLADANQLATYLDGLSIKINLIPYNSQERDRFKPPHSQVVDEFASRLRSLGYKTLVRTTKGSNIMAACGQLGNKEQRTRLHVM